VGLLGARRRRQRGVAAPGARAPRRPSVDDAPAPLCARRHARGRAARARTAASPFPTCRVRGPSPTPHSPSAPLGLAPPPRRTDAAPARRCQSAGRRSRIGPGPTASSRSERAGAGAAGRPGPGPGARAVGGAEHSGDGVFRALLVVPRRRAQRTASLQHPLAPPPAHPNAPTLDHPLDTHPPAPTPPLHVHPPLPAHPPARMPAHPPTHRVHTPAPSPQGLLRARVRG
jgi:hypothetical protein